MVSVYKKLSRWIYAGVVLKTLGLISAFLASMVLFGWHLDHPFLVAFGGDTATHYHSAIALLFAGAALIAVAFKYENLAITLGVVTGVFGLLAIAPFYLGGAVGLAVAPVRSDWVDVLKLPSRVSVGTILCLFICSGSFLLSSRFLRGNSLVWAVCGSVVSAVAIVSCFGHLAVLPGLYMWTEHAPMSVVEGICFLFLGAGLLVLSWRTEVEQQTQWWRWLPVPIFVGIFTATLVICQALLVQQQVELSPIEGTLSVLESRLPASIFGLGLFLAGLISFLVHLAQTVSRRAREAELANDHLKASDDHLRRQSVELMRAREQALLASKHKSEFLASMSHEIRTPMSTVVGVTELLLRDKLTSEQRENVQIIHYASNSLLSLINDILDFSKIESGRFGLDSTNFDLVELVKLTIDMLKPLAKQKQLSLDVSLDSNLHNEIQGDPNRLRQILVNLVGNAIKYTHDGGVRVSIEQISSRNEQIILKVEVSDSGLGISPEFQSQIFEQFERGVNPVNPNPAGTGLGLAISKRLVDLMGGTIGVESDPGKGSTFWFTAKFEKAVGNVPRVLRKRAVRRGKRKRILIVEDNPLSQRVTGKLLETLGFEVKVAGDGQDALELLREEPFDAVLMDCEMPRMDGYEATQRFRSYEHANASGHTPIIGLTAHAAGSNRRTCMDVGMDDFLVKPVGIGMLAEVIDTWTLSAMHKPKLEKTSSKDKTQPATDHRVDLSNITSLVSLHHLEDPDFVPDLLRMFRQNIANGLDKIKKSLKAHDFNFVGEEAHRMKSGCADLGARKMVTLCQELEDAADLKNKKLCNKWLNDLCDEHPKAIEILEREVKRSHSGEAA